MWTRSLIGALSLIGLLAGRADAQQPLGYGSPSTALASSLILKSAGGHLVDFQVNFGTCATTPCWVLVLDSATVPADGAVTPVKAYQVSANGTLGVTFTPDRLLMLNGIVLVCSTTGPFTKTATVQCMFSGETE